LRLVTTVGPAAQQPSQRGQLPDPAGEMRGRCGQLLRHTALATGGRAEVLVRGGQLTGQPGQVGGGLPVPQPPVLTPGQRGDLRRQLRLTRQVRLVGQHRDHPHPGSERLGQLPADPVGRVVDTPPALGVSGAQPLRADHSQQNRAAAHPSQQLHGEIRPGRNRLAVQEHQLGTEVPGHFGVQQCPVTVAVLAPVVDEHPASHHNSPPGPDHYRPLSPRLPIRRQLPRGRVPVPLLILQPRDRRTQRRRLSR
jgi:hypothetical protein